MYCYGSVCPLICFNFTIIFVLVYGNKEVKHDVYGRRQMAKITSDFFLFSSCYPQINHTKIEKYFQSTVQTEGKSFIFCSFLFDETSCLISLIYILRCLTGSKLFWIGGCGFWALAQP